jgi:hypothetical protein
MLSWKLTIKRRANYEQHTKPLWATTLATLKLSSTNEHGRQHHRGMYQILQEDVTRYPQVKLNFSLRNDELDDNMRIVGTRFTIRIG